MPHEVKTSKVKHYLLSNVKHSFIPLSERPINNASMLDAPELARLLRLAMDTHEPPVTSADMARACSVTPQAVNSWRKTGRVAKKHLPVIAALCGRGVEFFLGAQPQPTDARSARMLATWRALPPGLQDHCLRKVEEYAAYAYALPPFLRAALNPPADTERYRQWEKEIEADMAARMAVKK